jgi:uncharacterized protein YlxW (UPF0749 family)
VAALRDDVGARQREALKHSGGNGQAELLGLLSGAVEVRGPGVKLVVDDAEGAGDGGDGDPRGSSGFSDTGRVRDRDLQRVVNGLWESGAEAVSINGQRLTAPYTVLAVGDGKELSTRFQDSADGVYLHVLQENYGIRTAISVEDDLRLPAAPSLIVRTAQPRTETAQPQDEKGTS